MEFYSADGSLRLHAETHGPAHAPLTILCMHGLTRNSADFDTLALRLSKRYRVIVADQRGRGRSEWDPDPSNYQPAKYVADMFRLLDQLSVERVVLIGTSMGGIMSLLMAAAQTSRVIGMVLNDIGPEVPLAGLRRLRESSSTVSKIDNWSDAARHVQKVNGIAFPDYGAEQWHAFARRTFRENAHGRPVLAYDPRILDVLNATDLSAVPPDLWSVWDTLGDIPTLALRGELSDFLSAHILERMSSRHPNLTAVRVSRRGHAPMLDEPEACAAIDAFLVQLADVAARKDDPASFAGSR